MEIRPFQDYSNALMPMPALPVQEPSGNSQPTENVAPGQSFRNLLEDQINRTEPRNDIFSLSSGISSGPESSTGMLPSLNSYPAGPFHSAPGLLSSGEDAQDELMAMCRELEGFFLGLLLKNMGGSSTGGGIFSSSWESSVYQDMFYSELGNLIGTQSRGFGIAELLYGDIIMKIGNQSEELA